ncbi:MAG: AlpA family phage regulatory protein [Campylobacterales bacterium]|nr:AlpA family phage regulatory protein [Campylobacterales bacterium]
MSYLKVINESKENVDLTKGGLNIHKTLIRKKDVAEMLSMTMGQIDKLHDTDSTFPKKIEFGQTRQSMVRFFLEDILIWIEKKKNESYSKYHQMSDEVLS